MPIFRRRRAPRLSVVVPVYEVEDYLAACLDSVLASSFTDLEVVVVDDGSTDASGDIARTYAKRDKRVRVHRQDNAGLGAARNAGVELARGELLTFVDSDDTVTSDAYAAMVGALDESSSDLAIGNVVRPTPDGVERMAWMDSLHAERRLGIDAEQHPRILGDVFAWNKVYRRDFWERADMSFPEGVLYEDQPALTKAYLAADAFDVLVRPVYHWRVRDGSITTRRNTLRDVRDRMLTKHLATTEVMLKGSPALQEVWFRVVMSGDMAWYLREVPTCDDDYWRELQQGVASLWRHGYELGDSTLGAGMRLTGWLVQHDRREDAARVAQYVLDHDFDLPREERDGETVFLLPLLDDAGVPDHLFRKPRPPGRGTV